MEIVENSKSSNESISINVNVIKNPKKIEQLLTIILNLFLTHIYCLKYGAEPNRQAKPSFACRLGSAPYFHVVS